MNEKKLTLIIIIILIFLIFFLIIFFCYLLRKQKQNNIIFNSNSMIWNFSKFQLEAGKLLKSKKFKYSIIHINISKFKFFNDIYGYNEGNNILKIFGSVLSEEFSIENDIYASLWADHFVVLNKFENEEEIIERIKKLVINFNKISNSIYDFRFIFKAGIYIITDDDRRNNLAIGDLLQYANYALSTRKDSYKNEYVIYSDEMGKAFESLRLVDMDMFKAFYNNEYVPFYQPKYDINTKEIIGAEALVRWIHEDKGIMLPDAFLPYFEKSGFIVEVDYYIFEQTCKNLRFWLDSGFITGKISCNFSRLNMVNEFFSEDLKNIADKYNIPHNMLEIEITETAALEEIECLKQQIDKLRSTEFVVSIDDFGAGYSSLSLLQELNIDVIKLDKSFLNNCIPTKREYQVMKAIVSLAEKLNIDVICEGVETIEHVELLKSVNCMKAQGFYFAKPMPKNEIENMFKKQIENISK